ncbi:MAG: hypothetical protein K1Y01_02905 [Vicinamibacteria bacterium]|nr:hypothetical protein [Vicinamibacteria bacterium]
MTPTAPLRAVRVLSGRRSGSSRPVVVEIDEPGVGSFLLKLRGAAQGVGALVAEVAVARLAEALGLEVPARSTVVLPPEIPSDDPDQELRDLLRQSVGLNLGFEFLPRARVLVPSGGTRVEERTQAAVLWLDRFVLNPDRTARNPNLLTIDGRVVLIDHGACLRFQYNWDAVREDSPGATGESYEPHVFECAADQSGWREYDRSFARLITRDVLEAAFEAVPDDFILPLIDGGAGAEGTATALRRRRAAYVAYLWKRVAEPRSFASAPPAFAVSRGRGEPPAWLRDFGRRPAAL